MLPDLSARFLAPEGWITHSFTNPATGHKIHYGRVYPKDSVPKAVIVCFTGLSEFSEKYFEVAHDMLDRGYAFWIMDWQYQGRSGRMNKFVQRRHSDGFDSDISDMKFFVEDYVLPAAVHPDVGRIPLVMLAHSLGGHLGLRFLSEYPEKFDAAALSAPFLGIYKFSPFTGFAVRLLTTFCPWIKTSYIPGGTDWSENFRKSDAMDKFSSDPLRDTIHAFWSKSDAALQVGQPTLGWAAEALRSLAYMHRRSVLEKIKIPVLFALAGKDEIVDNAAIRHATAHLPHGQLLELSGARHEILMEHDEYRSVFFKAFDKMLEDNKIARIENVKKF
ncbi:MAG: alpha/beta hydrolase [Micavibrio aeruginosavorus]|uniref:Alpha/beta hydrolase n=1 Tax=Micavibrio aeruginosavorus TaxID=349221 RepID=A0A2W5N6G1_9BACT|nr:MAG: alpha/beta hydrolase [Micavibrio aeruginosavorus]